MLHPSGSAAGPALLDPVPPLLDPAKIETVPVRLAVIDPDARGDREARQCYPDARGNDGKNVAAGGVITDGPFAEGKEVIGGFSIIKAKDLAEASEIAKGCPIFEFPDGRVEVRPVQPM